MADDPKALAEEDQEEERGKALWSTDVDARKSHAAGPSCLGCPIFRIRSSFLNTSLMLHAFECNAAGSAICLKADVL